MRRSEGGGDIEQKSGGKGGHRKTLVAAMATFLILTAIMMVLTGERPGVAVRGPDDTPMVDGRVRAIEQAGTNIWVGGRFSQVKRRDRTVLDNVTNLAVFDSQTEQYKPIAPDLGGTGAEVFDMTLYGDDVLIAGKFAGPTSTQKNLVLVDGNTGKVIRWYNAPALKSVLAAPKLGRVYGGGVSLSAFNLSTGQKVGPGRRPQ